MAENLAPPRLLFHLELLKILCTVDLRTSHHNILLQHYLKVWNFVPCVESSYGEDGQT